MQNTELVFAHDTPDQGSVFTLGTFWFAQASQDGRAPSKRPVRVTLNF